MLGSTTRFADFGRSSNGPSGSRPVFGQNNNEIKFGGPNPFRSSTPFGSSTGCSEFGGTSTGVFGVNSPISFQQPTFGSPLPPAFGTSTAAFGSPSGLVFGTSSSSSGAFGQSSTAAFGTSSISRQNGTASSNPFTSNPFGSTTTFGTHRGESIFGGTSTGAFGINSSSPGQQTFGNSTAACDATLAPAFGTSSAFGQSSTAAFGTSSISGQNSTASSNPFTSNPFGSTTTFGTPRGGSIFGGTSTLAPAFGTSAGPSIFAVKPGFASSSSPNQSTSFGNTFQQAQTTFGTNPFGLSSSFSAASQNALGSSSTSGSTPTPSFAFGTSGAFSVAKPLGTSSTSAWGVSSTSAVGALQSPAFDASSTTRFSFVPTTPTVGLLNSATGSSSITSSFGTQSSSGGQSQTSTFSFGPQRRGSRLAKYTATAITEDGKTRKLQSISGMQINGDKNHEELRWEDYQSGDKVGIGTGGFTMQSNSFSPSPTLVQSPVNSYGFSNFVYPKLAPQTLFTPKADLPPSTSTSSPFNTSPSVSSVITTSSSAADQFVAPPIPSFSWNPTSVSGFNSGLISSNTQPSPVFQSVVTLPQTSSFSSIVPPVSFNSGMSSANPQSSPIFQSVAPLPQTGANSEFSGSLAGLSGFTDTTGVLGQSTFSLPSCSQHTEVAQPVPCLSPFGALPSMPQLSIGHLGSMPPIHYGISSMPVLDKPPTAAVRVSSLLTSRHLSQRRIRLPGQKYDPKRDGPKMPFFSDSKGLPTAAKGGAVFCRRENPRALVVLPPEQWPQTSDTKKMSQLVHASLHVYKNVTISEEVSASSLVNGSLHRYEDYHAVENTNSNNELKEQVTEVEASMPRLSRSDYYTEPQVPELAAKERAEPGFCSHVKNFVVGRHGYGSIKFLGETDVRNLDLDSHVKFNNREVMVYMDENEKPPVGEALNKTAEVTLLNIKCIDKMGNQYINGPKVDKYREMLIKKAEEQGAEFVSYDPVEGEWKFRVQHFSQYGF